MQSHTGVVRVFPAIPDDWKEVSFADLRAAGAFLVSARKEQGQVKEVIVRSEKGGVFKMIDPFDGSFDCSGADLVERNDTLEISFKPGQVVRMELK